MADAEGSDPSPPLPRGPRWLPWLLFPLLVLPFHPLWVDFEQVRRGLLMVLAGAGLLLIPRLPPVRGQRVAVVFVLGLAACGALQWLTQRWFAAPGQPLSLEPWLMTYRLLDWCAALVVVRLGAAVAPATSLAPLSTVLLLTSAFGLVQRFGLGEIGGYGVEREPVSTLGNLNVASEWTAVAAMAAAALGADATTARRRGLAAAAIGLAAAYLVVDGSRSGMIALPLGLVLLLLVRWRKRGAAAVQPAAVVALVPALMGAMLGLVAATGAAKPTPTDALAATRELQRSTATLEVRWEIARGATRLFADSPVFGQGPGQFQVQYPRVRSEREIELSSFGRRFSTEARTAHDDWLELLVDGGLPALALFAAMLFALQRGTRDKTRLLPLFVLLLLMLVRAPLGNAPAVAAAFWLVGVPAEAKALAGWRRAVGIATRIVLGAAMLALGVLPIAGNLAFVPYVRAQREAAPPPIEAARAATWWMPYEPRWLEAEARRALTAGDLPAAARAAARACSLRPFSPQYLVLLGEVLAKGGKYGEALQVAKEGLRRDPQNPELHVLEATSYTALGDVDRAIAALVVEPHPVLRAQLANVFADLATLADQKGHETDARRLIAEHTFAALCRTLGSSEEALLEQTGPLLSQLRNQLAAAGRAEEDLRPFVVGGLYALDLDKPDLARSFAAQAAKGRAKLLPWQRAMLDQRLLDRLGAIAEWRALLAR
ncbi:MAG: O-antigen ligase family protein [Planctomycetes bacterium]|nr:O-antigen ligase family protein [Planctomycetota bacterium]